MKMVIICIDKKCAYPVSPASSLAQISILYNNLRITLLNGIRILIIRVVLKTTTTILSYA